MRIRERLKKFWAKAKHKILMALPAAAAMASPAAAANGTTSVNWSQLAEMIRGAADIMPGIGDLVVAIVPVLLTLIIVGFVTGVFASIIDAIRDAFRFLR